jgi:hypothetical protein
MEPHWNALRHSIRKRPLPADWYPPIHVGDKVIAVEGKGLFEVKQIVNGEDCADLVREVCGQEDPAGASIQTNQKVCMGVFLATGLASCIPLLTLQRERSKVDILCNDCEGKSRTFFHHLGLECGKCGGFNTSRI